MKIFIADDLTGMGDNMPDVVRQLLKSEVEETAEVARDETPVHIMLASLTKTPANTPSLGLLADAEFSTEILDAIGAKLLHLGQVDQAELIIEAGLRGRIKQFGKDHPITAESYNTRGRLYRLKGDVVQAEKDVRRSLAINSRIYGEDSYAACVNLTELAMVQVQAGEFAGAERSAVRGLRILERLYLEETDPNTTRLLDVLGRVLQMKGLYTDAVEVYQRILQHDAKQPGRDMSLKYATHLANFAMVLLSQRSYAEAERMYRAAIDIYENKAKVASHPDLLDIRSGLAAVLAEQRQPSAIQEYDKLIQLGVQLRGAEHPYVGNDHAGRARAIYQLQQGNYLKDAQKEFEKALDIYYRSVNKGRLASDHAFIAEAKGWIARLLVEQGDALSGDPRIKFGREAEELVLGALQKFQAEFAEDSVEVAICRAVYARALTLQGKELNRALALLQASQSIVVPARGAASRIAQLVAQWIADLSNLAKNPGSEAGPGKKSQGA